MLGISDVWICLAYILSVLGAIGCVLYGILNWNKGRVDEKQIEESNKWKKDEKELVDQL